MRALADVAWRRRELIVELSRRELFQGHAGHVLSGIWVFANPLITLLIYFLVFRFVFPTKVPGGGSSEAFLLAGLIQWIVIADVMARSCLLLQQNSNLVKQISFPIEALVFKTVGSALFIQALMTVGLMAILVITGEGLRPTGVALWLLAIVLQTVFMLGLSLLLSAVTPFVRDITELVGVVARLGMFITPILYQANQFGRVAHALFYLNPFSYFAWIHQDALFAQSITRPVAWVGAAVLSTLMLAIGYRVFRQLAPAFNDVL